MQGRLHTTGLGLQQVPTAGCGVPGLEALAALSLNSAVPFQHHAVRARNGMSWCPKYYIDNTD